MDPMPLTRDFMGAVQARVRSDPEFRRALLKESVDCLPAWLEENEDAPAGADAEHRRPSDGHHAPDRASDSDH